MTGLKRSAVLFQASGIIKPAGMREDVPYLLTHPSIIIKDTAWRGKVTGRLIVAIF